MAVHQSLVRFEMGLVIHLGAVFDPIAKINIGQPQGFVLLDLPHHALSAEVGVGLRLIKGVNR